MTRSSWVLAAALAALSAGAAVGAEDDLDVTLRVLQDVHGIDTVIGGDGTPTRVAGVRDEAPAARDRGGNDRTDDSHTGTEPRAQSDADRDSTDRDAQVPPRTDAASSKHAIVNQTGAPDSAGAGANPGAHGDTPPR